MKNNPATFQDILNQSSEAMDSTGIVARIEIDDEHWSGASKSLDTVNADRGFYICSLSKTYTAVAVMRLVEQGRLALDEKLASYLTEIDPFGNVTLRELLNHTSRIPDYVGFENYLEDVYNTPEKPWTRECISSKARERGFLELPEGSWSYSNTGYMYLLQVIETVTGKAFSEAINDLIISPLKLRSTYVATGIDKERALIPAHDKGFAALQGDIRPQYHPDWCATGVLVSNTNEVCFLYEKLLSGTILSEDSMREVLEGIQTPYWIGGKDAPYNGKLAYGLGIRICETFPLGPFFGHSGDCPGYSIWAGYLSLSDGRNLTSCVVCNSSNGAPGEVWMKMISHISSKI